MADAQSTKKEKSRRHFDRWARSYENDPTSRWLSNLQTVALEALDLTLEDRLLDVGCGTGAAVRQAAPRVKRAVGADLSPAMIERAREFGAGIANAKFVEADSEQLPFGDGEFTAVLCTTSFHHYPDPRRAVDEMARVLAPAGRAVIGDGCSDLLAARLLDWTLRLVERSHVHFYRSRELERLLAGAGLAHLDTRLLLRGGYAIVAARKDVAATAAAEGSAAA